MRTGDYIVINSAVKSHFNDYRDYKDQIKHVLDVFNNLNIGFNNEKLDGSFYFYLNMIPVEHLVNHVDVMVIKSEPIRASQALDTMTVKAYSVGNQYKYVAHKAGKLVYESSLLDATTFSVIDGRRLVNKLAKDHRVEFMDSKSLNEESTSRSLQDIMQDPRPGEALTIARKLADFSNERAKLEKRGDERLQEIHRMASNLVTNGLSAYMVYTYIVERYNSDFTLERLNKVNLVRDLTKSEMDSGVDLLDVSNIESLDQQVRHEFMAAFNQNSMNKLMKFQEFNMKARKVI